ncbi:cupin domain-containing protein [Candidatus Gottesmanbacteria bacterium]|nr:cupin domain-containing protein [Candidatus Gottesmanbacteria bacterium]
MKVNLQDIPTEMTHNNTTFRKRLITVEEKKGRIATSNYARLTKGSQLEPHAHTDGEEFYLFLEGSGEMLVGEEWMSVGKGDFVTVPKNAVHSIKNTLDENLVFLTIRTISD